MSDRYYVGSGFWHDITKWSETSGGPTGASMPTANDNVFFDSNSISCIIGSGTNVSCNNLDCTGYVGTLYLGQQTGEGLPASIFTVYGDCILSSGMSVKSYSVDEPNFASNAGLLTIYGELNADGTTLGGVLYEDDLGINLQGTLGTVQNLTADFVNASSGKTIFAPTSTLTSCQNMRTTAGPTTTIHITTFAGLQAMSSDLTAEYILDNNINCSGEVNFVPIGTVANPFTGSFNGQGFTISNMNINISSYSNTLKDVGLFGVVDGLFIRELNLFNITLKGGFRVGSLIGTLKLGDVIDCHITGIDLTKSTRSGIDVSTVGGLIGRISIVSTLLGVYVTDCSVSGEIVLDSNAVGGGGGFVGNTNGKSGSDYNLNFSNCTSSVNINVPTPAFGRDASGFAASLVAQVRVDNCSCIGTLTAQQVSGFVHNIFTDVTIRGCYSKSDINASNTCAGFCANSCFDNVNIHKCYYSGNIVNSTGSAAGFINEIDDADVLIKNCYVRGTLSSSGTGVGGFLGGSIFSGTIRNCYTAMAVIGNSRVGGFMGNYQSSLAITIENCFSVGVVTASTTFGGFIGRTAGSGSVNLINCSWWTGASVNAIGSLAGVAVALLATGGYGTDESNKNNFKTTTDHVVFAQV